MTMLATRPALLHHSGRTTSNLYDQLNRIKQITDPAAGNTYLAYDSQDNLTTVTDPRGKVTSYTYSGFGDLKTQTSPDTGLTANSHDSAGNLATSTDARGAISTYTYDARNRVTSVAFTKSGVTDQTITYSYDQGTYGKGRLTGAADANHTMSWVYDPQGRVTSKTQSVGAVSRTVAYGYTNGQLTSLTLPSGTAVVVQLQRQWPGHISCGGGHCRTDQCHLRTVWTRQRVDLGQWHESEPCL